MSKIDKLTTNDKMAIQRSNLEEQQPFKKTLNRTTNLDKNGKRSHLWQVFIDQVIQYVKGSINLSFNSTAYMLHQVTNYLLWQNQNQTMDSICFNKHLMLSSILLCKTSLFQWQICILTFNKPNGKQFFKRTTRLQNFLTKQHNYKL